MWGNTVAIHSVLKKKTTKVNFNQLNIKKIKSTKTILEKKTKKKEDNFGKKEKKKQEKKHVGKVKAKFSTSSILKKNI